MATNWILSSRSFSKPRKPNAWQISKPMIENSLPSAINSTEQPYQVALILLAHVLQNPKLGFWHTPKRTSLLTKKFIWSD